MPIERFRVPGLLIGPGVPRRHDTRVTSQIDLAPTLLGLLGITQSHPMIGRDVLALAPEIPGRAMMQYADTNAFRVADEVVIHQPHQAAKTYTYVDGRLVPQASNREMERDALAHLLWADTSYRDQLYRLPGTEGANTPSPRSAAPRLLSSTGSATTTEPVAAVTLTSAPSPR